MGFDIIPTEIFKKEAKRFPANHTPLSSENHFGLFRTHPLPLSQERFYVRRWES